MYKNALGRSDATHIRMSADLPILINCFFILNYFLAFVEKKSKIKKYDDLINEVVDKLKSTINYWETSEEKLSLCLSDGVDSNILLKLLTSKSKNLETFSIGLNPKEVPFKKNKHK